MTGDHLGHPAGQTIDDDSRPTRDTTPLIAPPTNRSLSIVISNPE
jgi:hypothetical protein